MNRPFDPVVCNRQIVHATAVAFKYVLESRSDGKFDVQIYPAGSLDKKNMAQMEAIKKGDILC